MAITCKTARICVNTKKIFSGLEYIDYVWSGKLDMFRYVLWHRGGLSVC